MTYTMLATKDVLKLASIIRIPHWATHIAVSNNGQKVEPALWDEQRGEYLDDDPSKGDFFASFKGFYFEFVSLERLSEECRLLHTSETPLATSELKAIAQQMPFTDKFATHICVTEDGCCVHQVRVLGDDVYRDGEKAGAGDWVYFSRESLEQAKV